MPESLLGDLIDRIDEANKPPDPRMLAAHERHEGSDISAADWIGRAIPFAARAFRLMDDEEYRDARNRIKEGKPFGSIGPGYDSDFDTVARYEARQRTEATRGTLGTIGSAFS